MAPVLAAPEGGAPEAVFSPAAILSVMEHAADYQFTNHGTNTPLIWTSGAFYTGVMALAGISGDSRYYDAMLRLGETNDWKLAPRKFDADDHCVGQAYAELYLRYGDKRMITPLRDRFDDILNHPTDVKSLEFKKPSNRARENWSWCDSLFMAPPVWMRLYAATRDTRYMDFAVTNWWRTSDYLYDKTNHLFFRDSSYFTKHETNGAKMFWSRGNGWVIAGLVRVLEVLPSNHPARPRFVQQYREMADRLLALQQADGLWRASLLDPDSYPLKETSGSGFYTYAFAWGINQGLLDRARFEPAVHRGWRALVDCVREDGRLTHVQPIGADPKKFDANATESYGVGAFLLAGSEMYKLALLKEHPVVHVTIRNPAKLARLNETVELGIGDLARRLKTAGVSRFAIMDSATTRILDSQDYSSDPGKPADKLLFQADLAPGETRSYLVFDASALPATPCPVQKTYARLITERMNDMAWESDRQAHRMYQLALIKGEGTISSGIDVWSKRTRSLVVDKWYKGANYHEDHGEGIDDFRVGRSRGCGGLGIWDGNKLYVSVNFKEGRVLTTGPIRSEFELTYDSWDAGGRKVCETKRISIDAGSNISRAQSTFTSDHSSSLGIGIGIAQRPLEGTVVKNQKENWMAYWQPADRDRGNIGTAVIVPTGIKEFTLEKDTVPAPSPADLLTPNNEGLPAVANLLAITRAKPGRPFVYYFGSGWSKSGDFPDAPSWEAYVAEYAQRLKQPLKVSLSSR